MKRPILKFITATAALACAVAFGATPAFANSGIYKEWGITGAGVWTRNEESALAVESEKLTFDICDFPQIVNTGSGEYKSTVTAEYKFVNTSADTVHTSMAFPLGSIPSYFNSSFSLAPEISVDGQPVEYEVRHTYGTYDYNGRRTFEEGVSKIKDEWFEDEFYKPDTPVTAFTVLLDIGNCSTVIATGSVTCDKSKARYMYQGFGADNEIEFYYRTNGDDLQYYVDRGRYTVYILGDASEFSCTWEVKEMVYNHNNPYTRPADIPVQITQVTNEDGTPFQTTLKDLVLSMRPEEQDGKQSVVSDLDYYNGLADAYFWTNAQGAYAGSSEYLTVGDSSFCTWYIYDVEVEPNGSIINKVTAPLYPDVNLSYNPYVYEYKYYLSPAKSWKSFGSLDIEIRTSAYMRYSSITLDKNEETYSAKLETLPEDELSFKLCTEENPKIKRGTYIPLIFILVILLFAAAFPLAGFIIAIVYLVRKR